MSERKHNSWVGWVAFLFVIVHFSFIVSYSLPEQFSHPKLKSVSIPYVEPIFTQSWGMFAPCPTVNGRLEAKFYFDEDSTEWIFPMADAKEKHAVLRGSHHGELALAESNLIYWIQLDFQLMSIDLNDSFPVNKIGQFQQGYSYFQIKDFLSGTALYLYNRNSKSARIRVYLEDVITHKESQIELPIFTY